MHSTVGFSIQGDGKVNLNTHKFARARFRDCVKQGKTKPRFARR